MFVRHPRKNDLTNWADILEIDDEYVRIYQNKTYTYSRFDTLLSFKVAYLIVTSLHNLLNGSTFLTHYERKTVHRIKNVMTWSRKPI